MLSRAVEVVKQNPWKITLGTVATVIFSIGGVLFSDARYAFKEDVKKDKAETMQLIQDLQKQVKELSR